MIQCKNIFFKKLAPGEIRTRKKEIRYAGGKGFQKNYC